MEFLTGPKTGTSVEINGQSRVVIRDVSSPKNEGQKADEFEIFFCPEHGKLFMQSSYISGQLESGVFLQLDPQSIFTLSPDDAFRIGTI